VKPPPFAYHAPQDVDEALDLLAAGGSEDGGTKVLAGGQSLLPLLSMRLAAPSALVDIGGLGEELGYVRVEGDGDGSVVRVGALARHADVLRDEAAYSALPLLRQALRHVAHPAIRNRGTTVGSIAHADPAGEMTVVLALVGGSVDVAKRGSRRKVAAADLFVGPLETSLSPDELVVSASFPVRPVGTGTAFVELARRSGDYALCGVAAEVTVDDGTVTRARCAYLAMSDVPLVIELTDVLSGASADDELDTRPAVDVVDERVEPETDLHASADYRRHLAGVLTTRALRAAVESAGEQAA
jgi:aerobic carbon-monoxide dehydrogenase medium subunit